MGRWIVVPALMLMAAPAVAAAPTAEQKAEFYKVCVGISSNVALCTCKADAAMDLIDERFMGIVIASMKGGSPAGGDYAAYNAYVAKSNQICKPNY
ncbi:hypothetical protein VW29_03445 [Devosia limi DSM 17137]|uniref:Rap1a immunity protein domain-containing protein n=1 Tax=Devosia limi DSM 17137 TaxID=1121477 RepID=A0A0F5LV25_9HYPH|nr:hypothetical protein [Devosia limi]KKB86225.1 hypothetical protein VW29_03000 [Devosia limi DSM 17137]KKB86301.1 hypothetical protein VW29_03445 [Devosia limi DSM 17137]SHF14286.1 hypothetical protein SAMN02745223_01846 [Devosia limi DSM 17137]